MNNNPDLSNNINDSEESNLQVDLKRTVSQFFTKTQKLNNKISRWSILYLYRCNNKKIKQKNTLIFSDSMPSRNKIHDFNIALSNGKTKYLLFPGTTSKRLLQYLNVHS